MKRIIHSLLSGVLALLTMAACQVAELEGVTGEQKQITITAGIENDGILPLDGEQVVPETKTIRVADDRGTHVYWTPGDEISLFYGSGDQGGSKFVSTNTENAIQAQFTGTIGVITGGSEGGVESISFWGVYPYSKDNSCADGSVSLTIPSEQESAEGTFSVGQLPTVGKSLGLAMSFKNVACGYKFKVEHSGIKEIIISAKSGNLSGRISVSMDSSGNVSVADGGSGSGTVTVRPQGGGSFKPGVYYYVTMIHNPDYAQGITWTFVTETSSATYECDFSGGNRDFPSKISAFKTMDNKDSGLEFASHLPNGTVFKDYLKEVAGGWENIKIISFRSNSNITGTQIAQDVYASFDASNGRVFIDTPKQEFIANPDCSEMFRYFSNLNGVYFNGCVNTSLVTDMSQMFSDLDKLTEVDFTGFDTSNVTNMADMFYCCFALQSLDLSSFNTRNVTTMGYMLEFCYSLREVLLGKDFVIPDGCFTEEFVVGPNVTFYGSTETMESFQKMLYPGSEYDKGCLHFAIDMGDAGWWSAWNVGAEKPEDCGSYFAWGETTEKSTYDWSKDGDYKWGVYDESAAPKYGMTKYTGDVEGGDGLYTLLPEDDPATVNWRGHWRTPTANEINELFDETKYKLTWDATKKGFTVKSLKTGNSIFLPAAGVHGQSKFLNDDSVGYYWSSSVIESDPLQAYFIWLDSWAFVTTDLIGHSTGQYRLFGLPVRAVTSFGDVDVTGISLSETSMTLEVGKSLSLYASVSPSNATNRGVSWHSNDISVATVSSAGVVKAVAPGTTTITVLSNNDFNIRATCTVTVYKLPEKVLSGKFSVADGRQIQFSPGNLQATYDGSKYSWGFADSQYDYVGNAAGNTTIDSQTKGAVVDLFGWSTASTNFGINTSEDYADYSGDFVDWGKTFGDGSTWRTMTEDEWLYLFNGRDNADDLFRYGVTVCGKTNCLIIAPDDFGGTIDASYDASSWPAAEAAGLVCLPAAGERFGSNVKYVGDEGGCWSSLPSVGGYAFYVSYTRNWVSCGHSSPREYGISVRLITDVGFAPTEPAKEDPLSGKFSVAKGRKVQFSKGNLQATYDGSKYRWRIADNQYDYVGNAAGNTTIDSQAKGAVVDLFGWSTKSTYFGINTSRDETDYSGDFVDWGKKIGNAITWRTLTKDEWEYLFYDRTDASKLHRCGVTVCGKTNCVIIAPDDFGGTIDASYDASSWPAAEAAGLVCLPAAGERFSSSVSRVGNYGYYWSSSPHPSDDGSARNMFFDYESVRTIGYETRYTAHSVRLVTVVK